MCFQLPHAPTVSGRSSQGIGVRGLHLTLPGLCIPYGQSPAFTKLRYLAHGRYSVLVKQMNTWMNVNTTSSFTLQSYHQGPWKLPLPPWAEVIFPHTLIECSLTIYYNMPENLENSAVATGLEKISFHSSPKERQCQRMFKLLHNCPHFTR